MRAIIATDFNGQLRKLIWLTENEEGVSAGIYDAKHDPHASYHVDGTYHLKFTNKEIFPEKKVPLRDIATEQQLLGTGFYYVDDIMTRLPRFTPDRRVDALVVLGESVFSDIAYASFNISIVHRTYEPAFIAAAYSSYEDKSFMVVAVNLFGLHLFTDHQVGVIIYKGRKTR